MEELNIKSQMRKGLLEYCILLCLAQLPRAYPSDLLERLKDANLIIVEGTIYTLLNRLRKEGKLDYEWEESPMGPPRKYYSITPLGRQTLNLFDQAWLEVSSSVNSLREAKKEAQQNQPTTTNGNETDN